VRLLNNRVVAGLQAHFGPESERLIEFGIPPRKRRKRRKTELPSRRAALRKPRSRPTRPTSRRRVRPSAGPFPAGTDYGVRGSSVALGLSLARTASARDTQPPHSCFAAFLLQSRNL